MHKTVRVIAVTFTSRCEKADMPLAACYFHHNIMSPNARKLIQFESNTTGFGHMRRSLRIAFRCLDDNMFIASAHVQSFDDDVTFLCFAIQSVCSERKHYSEMTLLGVRL